MKRLTTAILVGAMLAGGCNISPLSPNNRPKIRNNGEIGDIKSNQNGIMAELMNIKNKMEILARDVENIQNGFINNNNRNFGVQIFHGEGGLAAGIVLLIGLGLLVVNYRLKSERYRKTAEVLGNQIRKIADRSMKDDLLIAAMEKKVETEVYRMIKP